MSTKIILLFSLALDDTSSEAKKGQGPTIINLIEDFYPRNAHSRAHVSRFAIFFKTLHSSHRQIQGVLSPQESLMVIKD